MLTAFLFEADHKYREWKDELVLTSGSETTVKHGYTSLHYATPAQAVDIRSWCRNIHHRGYVPSAEVQATELKAVAKDFCNRKGIPASWIEIILEGHHIHIEYQPKRPEALN
jgi:selenophosphate synthetase-related protein